MPQELCDSFVFNAVSNIISAIVGAGAAAVPAFFLARKASTEALLRDREGRRLGEKAAMLRAMVKFIEIVNGLGSLNRRIESSIANPEADLVDSPYLWPKVPPIIGIGDREFVFDADELAPLLRIKEVVVLNNLLELSAGYARLKAGVATYTHRRTLLTDELSNVTHGPIGTLDLGAEETSVFRPRFDELDGILTQIRGMARSHYESALDLAVRFGSAARCATDDQSFPVLDTRKAPPPMGSTMGDAEA